MSCFYSCEKKQFEIDKCVMKLSTCNLLLNQYKTYNHAIEPSQTRCIFYTYDAHWIEIMKIVPFPFQKQILFDSIGFGHDMMYRLGPCRQVGYVNPHLTLNMSNRWENVHPSRIFVRPTYLAVLSFFLSPFFYLLHFFFFHFHFSVFAGGESLWLLIYLGVIWTC